MSLQFSEYSANKISNSQNSISSFTDKYNSVNNPIKKRKHLFKMRKHKKKLLSNKEHFLNNETSEIKNSNSNNNKFCETLDDSKVDTSIRDFYFKKVNENYELKIENKFKLYGHVFDYNKFYHYEPMFMMEPKKYGYEYFIDVIIRKLELSEIISKTEKDDNNNFKIVNYESYSKKNGNPIINTLNNILDKNNNDIYNAVNEFKNIMTDEYNETNTVGYESCIKYLYLLHMLKKRFPDNDLEANKEYSDINKKLLVCNSKYKASTEYGFKLNTNIVRVMDEYLNMGYIIVIMLFYKMEFYKIINSKNINKNVIFNINEKIKTNINKVYNYFDLSTDIQKYNAETCCKEQIEYIDLIYKKNNYEYNLFKIICIFYIFTYDIPFKGDKIIFKKINKNIYTFVKKEKEIGYSYDLVLDENTEFDNEDNIKKFNNYKNNSGYNFGLKYLFINFIDRLVNEDIDNYLEEKELIIDIDLEDKLLDKYNDDKVKYETIKFYYNIYIRLIKKINETYLEFGDYEDHIKISNLFLNGDMEQINAGISNTNTEISKFKNTKNKLERFNNNLEMADVDIGVLINQFIKAVAELEPNLMQNTTGEINTTGAINTTETEKSNKLSIGAIIGISIGSLVLLVLIIFFVVKTKRKKIKRINNRR